MGPLLEVDHLDKRYGAVVVADDICCKVDGASCVGLIGPNGAGKSSLFNMLTGIVRAFQIPRPFAQLSVYENVLTAALYGAGLPGHRARRLALDVLNRTGLL